MISSGAATRLMRWADQNRARNSQRTGTKGNTPAATSAVDENGASRITLATGCRLASPTATPVPSESAHTTTGLDGERDVANPHAAPGSVNRASSAGLPVWPLQRPERHTNRPQPP